MRKLIYFSLPLLLIFPLLAQGPLPWIWMSTDGKTSGWKSSTILGQVPITGVACTSTSPTLSIQLMAMLPNGTCLPIVMVTPTGLFPVDIDFKNVISTVTIDPTNATTK